MIERFARLPSALEANTRWERLGSGNAPIPVMLVHPNWESATPVPIVIWMHGRTARKEIDPGRFLRLMRSGIGACSVDLPGHGERFDAALQDPRHTLEVVLQMEGEIDTIVEEVAALGSFDPQRIAIGGMSAGGMATLVRLCRPHNFRCASVEATSGSWQHQQHREMFEGRSDSEIAAHNPINHLDDWREIPLQAIHTRADAWVDYEGQAAFIDALRKHYANPELIEFITYEETGAPFEHAGFGRMASDAKDRQRAFFERHLLSDRRE